jgi:hypothetical protein
LIPAAPARIHHRVRLLSRLLVLLFLAAPVISMTGPASSRRPFSAGERAEYDVRYGVFHAGVGTLSVVSIDTVRGRDAYRFRMTLNGGVNVLLYHYEIRDTMESWVDTATFQSLRFVQRQLHRGKPRDKHYEIFPDRRVFVDGDHNEQPSVADPLDDIALLFFVRGQPLAVGTTIDIPRHFKPGSNPITLTVLRKDTIEAAGKRWPTIVVQPTIKTSTMFGDGKAQVWLADDSTRVIVQINARAAVGSITMRLRSYEPAGAAQR